MAEIVLCHHSVAHRQIVECISVDVVWNFFLGNGDAGSDRLEVALLEDAGLRLVQ